MLNHHREGAGEPLVLIHGTGSGHTHFTGSAEVAGDVVIAWGDQDRLLFPVQSQRAAWAIPAARSVTLHGCGHVPMDDDPGLTAHMILAATGAE